MAGRDWHEIQDGNRRPSGEVARLNYELKFFAIQPMKREHMLPKISRRAKALVVAVSAVFLMLPAFVVAQSAGDTAGSGGGFGKIDPTPPTGVTPDQIVAKMSAKETEYKKALANYTWTQDIKEQTLLEGKVDGEYHVIYNITFDSQKNRTERVVFAPQNTLERIIMTENDVQELEHKDAYPLTEDDIARYDLSYVGRQKVDELDTYVFEVTPKVMDMKRRRFQGRIWVDQEDSQIVLSSGKFVPQNEKPGHEDLSPPFTTYREQVDGKYWFPVYTHGDGVLHFHASKNSPSEDIHIREIIKYTDYKQFGSSFRIVDTEEIKADAKPSK
jgi:hypothetical protein